MEDGDGVCVGAPLGKVDVGVVELSKAAGLEDAAPAFVGVVDGSPSVPGPGGEGTMSGGCGERGWET